MTTTNSNANSSSDISSKLGKKLFKQNHEQSHDPEYCGVGKTLEEWVKGLPKANESHIKCGECKKKIEKRYYLIGGIPHHKDCAEKRLEKDDIETNPDLVFTMRSSDVLELCERLWQHPVKDSFIRSLHNKLYRALSAHDAEWCMCAYPDCNGKGIVHRKNSVEHMGIRKLDLFSSVLNLRAILKTKTRKRKRKITKIKKYCGFKCADAHFKRLMRKFNELGITSEYIDDVIIKHRKEELKRELKSRKEEDDEL
jgi:hypothetical protein